MLLDPRVSGDEPHSEFRGWTPMKRPMAKAVVRVPATNAHGAINVFNVDLLARDSRDDLHEPIDGHHLFAAEIERLPVIATHQANDALHTTYPVTLQT